VALAARVALLAAFIRPAAGGLDARSAVVRLRAVYRLPRRALDAGLAGAVLAGAAALLGGGGVRQAVAAMCFAILASSTHVILLPTMVLARRLRVIDGEDSEVPKEGLALGTKLALACFAPALAASSVASAATMDHLGASLLAAGVLVALTGALYAGLSAGPASAAAALSRALVRLSRGDHGAEVGAGATDDEIGRAAHALKYALVGLANDMHTTRDAVIALDRKGAELSAGAANAASAVRAEADGVSHVGRLSDDLDRLAKEADGASERLVSELRRVTDLFSRVGFGTSEAVVDAEGLSRAAENAIEATQQMEQTIARVSNRSQGLSQAAADTAASTAAMDDAIARVRLAAEDTASLSARVAQEAERGYRAVHKTLDEIERIRNLVEVAQRTIEDLGSRVGGIGQVVLVIEEIAQKSNLLALNASIIAAQAGEQGRGFAVVASGIKALASRTAASTKEIAAQISGIQVESVRARETMATGVEAVSQGFHVAVGAGDALGEIRQSARAAQKKVHGIARAMEEQAGASRRVADATNQVASMSRELADAVRAHLSGGERIRETAQHMLDVASRVERRLREQLAGASYDSAIADVQGATQSLQRTQKEQQRGIQRVAAAAVTVREADRAALDRLGALAKIAIALRDEATQLRRKLEGDAPT
jgi:methyl-accepting chemotaxis protein